MRSRCAFYVEERSGIGTGLRVVSGLTLTLLLVSMVFVVYDMPVVVATGTIYIRADGSIDPPTAPIQRDGDLYTLTGNITSDADGIVIERNNMTLDGAGYTLQGMGDYPSVIGINLSGRNNVTIKNMEVNAFYFGIVLADSSNNTIVENKIAARVGFYVRFSSSHNRISENNIMNSDYGIIADYFSSYNSIVRNNITNSNGYGIQLWQSYHNSISENTIASNRGIYLTECSNNSISLNNLTNHEGGIWLENSSTINITGNMFTNDGLLVWHSYGNVVEDNLVNGKPLVYLEGVSGFTIENAGQVILVNCDSIRVENLNLSRTSIGVELWETNNSIISGNNITANNLYGICLYYSSNYNSITGNIITANAWGGIMFEFGSSNNNSISGNHIANHSRGIWVHAWEPKYNSIVGNNITKNYEGIIFETPFWNNYIYHNNFVDNICHASLMPFAVFDDGYPSGGNYWSDYTGIDLYNGPYQNVTGSDGVGDTPYAIYSNNQDNYPFMSQNGWQTHPIAIENNVTITSMKANRYSLNFTASGPSGQIGYVNATVPVGLNQSEIKVFLDGVELIPPPFPIITTNGTHYFIYFEFTLSTHTITIQYAIADIATTNITPSKTIVGQGYTIRINATIQNQGDYEENFNVKVYANTTSITSQTITLARRSSLTITFNWNTAGFAKGNYTIWAYASPIPGETDTLDNTKTADNMVKIGVPGDLNNDNKCNILDLVKEAGKFGAEKGDPNSPPAPKYDPNYDFNDDNKINILDLVKLAGHFGTTDP